MRPTPVPSSIVTPSDRMSTTRPPTRTVSPRWFPSVATSTSIGLTAVDDPGAPVEVADPGEAAVPGPADPVATPAAPITTSVRFLGTIANRRSVAVGYGRRAM